MSDNCRIMEAEFQEGVFLQESKNRFLCEVDIDGTPTVCYVPSSCHLGNFLQLNGKRVLLAHTASPKARTKYAVWAVPYKRSFIVLSPAAANRAVMSGMKSRRFHYLGRRKSICRETVIGGYKSDLYISDTDTIIEIKAVISTHSEAPFPSVYSERSINQMLLLKQRLENGRRACLMIVSLNPYVKRIRIDSSYEIVSVLKQCVEKGLILKAYSCRFTPESGVNIEHSIPILW